MPEPDGPNLIIRILTFYFCLGWAAALWLFMAPTIVRPENFWFGWLGVFTAITFIAVFHVGGFVGGANRDCFYILLLALFASPFVIRLVAFDVLPRILN